MPTKDLLWKVTELSDAEFQKLVEEREKSKRYEEQYKAERAHLKASLAHVLTSLHARGDLPDWINVAGASDKNGKVNFYRALKVSKPKD